MFILKTTNLGQGDNLNFYIVFTIVMMVLIIYKNISSKKLTALNFRKNQLKDFSSENLIKVRIEEYTSKKVEFSKRYHIETICLQAGLKWKYVDYVMFSGTLALILGLTFGLIFKNPIMAIMFLAIGYILPLQIIGFLKNRRVLKIERQIGPFMNMVIKRYENSKDFVRSLQLSLDEFKGEEPMYSEIKKTITEIDIGVDVGEAMDNMARRTGNQYLARFSDYYKIAYKIGTDEIRKKLLNQAYIQFEENQRLKNYLKKEITEPVREAYMTLLFVPIFAGMGIFNNKGYISYMTETLSGQIIVAIVFAIVLASIYFINAKIAAPLD